MVKLKSSLGFSPIIVLLLLILIGAGAYFLWTQKKVIFNVVASPTPITKYNTCPANGYVDCMPRLGESPSALCSKDYLDWAKTNCPNFKGAAY